MLMLPVRILLSFSLIVATGASSAQDGKRYPKDLFSVAQFKFDEVRNAHGAEWYLQSREAKVIIASIAGGMGIHPGYVAFALNAVPKTDKRGEEAYYNFPVADGYKYCASRVRLTSLMSGGGDRPPEMAIQIRPAGPYTNPGSKISNALPEHMHLYTWVPYNQMLKGDASVEGEAQVYGIKKEYLAEFIGKGICKKNEEVREFVRCGGDDCKGMVDGKPGKVGEETPALKEGW